MHSFTNSRIRPPAPTPPPRPLGPLALLKAVRANPLECWTKAHFEEPIVLGGFPFMRYAVVSDPAAIRKILIEDHSAYRKSAIERRVLAPPSTLTRPLGMSNGKDCGAPWRRYSGGP